MFQFVLPIETLPDEYYEIMDEVEGVYYTPITNPEFKVQGCVKLELDKNNPSTKKIILFPLSLKASFDNSEDNVKKLIKSGYQISIILKDIETASASDLERYSEFLKNMVSFLTNFDFSHEESPLNIITDRIHLRTMNNCDAGVSSITFAPDCKFYLCPAFYYDGDSPLDVDNDGLIIPNHHLLKIGNAPICSHCDAFQCHRCIYLNKKGTREVNTPTRNQCLIAHLERNASRLLASNLKWIDGEERIPKLSYLDPFELLQRK